MIALISSSDSLANNDALTNPTKNNDTNKPVDAWQLVSSFIRINFLSYG